MAFDDTQSLRRLRDLFREHLSAGGTETPERDDGDFVAPDYTFQTPAPNEDWDKLNAQRGFWEKVVLGRAPRGIIDDAATNPEQYGGAELSFIKSLDPKAFTRKSGNMYEVGIHEDPAKFLDWDRPLSGQNELVQRLAKESFTPDAVSRDIPGGSIYHGMLGTQDHPSTASDFFKEAGVPGIRYLDQGSRSSGAGSSNYVVFPGNEGLIDITRKYATGGEVENDFLNYHPILFDAHGGSVDADMLAWNMMHDAHGGPVSGHFRGHFG